LLWDTLIQISHLLFRMAIFTCALVLNSRDPTLPAPQGVNISSKLVEKQTDNGTAHEAVEEVIVLMSTILFHSYAAHNSLADLRAFLFV